MGEQYVVHRARAGSIVAMDSAYDVRPANRDIDVVVAASYCGVLPARFIAEHHPRGLIGMDCAIGPEGAAIAGLWYLEALAIPAAAADVSTAELGNGIDVYDEGRVSRANAPAIALGIVEGMLVRDAALAMLESAPPDLLAREVTNRTVMVEEDGRSIVCTDSIAFGLEEDRGRNVLCTAGHTGRSAVPYLRQVAPRGFICSDGGGGKNASGTAGLVIVESDGLAGATVDARTARMGDGLSTYRDGVISACNSHARACGVREGQPAHEGALLLLHGGMS